jgi:thiol-disulfide isomerase/thioredoxin
MRQWFGEHSVGMAALLLLTLLKQGVPMEQGSSVLSAESFRQLNDTVLGNEFVLIAFVAPNCDKCRTLRPNLDWAAKRMEEDKIPGKIVRVDLSTLSQDEAQVKELYKVGDVPTIKWAIRGNISEYDGQFSANGIFDWIHRQAFLSRFVLQKMCKISVVCWGSAQSAVQFPTRFSQCPGKIVMFAGRAWR